MDTYYGIYVEFDERKTLACFVIRPEERERNHHPALVLTARPKLVATCSQGGFVEVPQKARIFHVFRIEAFLE